MRLPARVDAPVKGTRTLGGAGLALTADWAYTAVTDCERASSKGSPAGDLVEYAVAVEGDGAIYLCEGDVTELDPAPTGIRVTSSSPFNGTCRAAGIEGLSLRSEPDGVVGQLVVGTTTFTV